MRSAAAFLLALGLAACSSVADLGKPQRPLASDEVALTRKKVDEAVAAKKFKVAWNLEAAAGTTDAKRFEDIALATLAADDGDAKDMLEQIRKKFGGYSASLKAGISDLVQRAIDERDYKRAVDIRLVSAEDAPAFKDAWDVYTVTPSGEALGILERINKARDDYEEAQAKKKAQ